MSEKLILVITNHSVFGWIMSLYSAKIIPERNLVLYGAPDVNGDFPEGWNLIIVEAAKLTEKALLKLFSKDKDKEDIPQNIMEIYVRPYIEKVCVRLVELAESAGVNIYFRGGVSQNISQRNRVEIIKKSSLCVFNFIKDGESLRYFISLSNGDEELCLQQKPAAILSTKPCVVMLGGKIHRIEDISAKKLLPFFSKTYIEVPQQSEYSYLEKFVLKTIPRYRVRVEGIEMKELEVEKRARLVLEEDFYSRLVLSLFFDYGNRSFKPSRNQAEKKIASLETVNEETRICFFERDFEWENLCIERLTELGLKREHESLFRPENRRNSGEKYGLIDFISQHKSELSEFLIERNAGKEYYLGKFEIRSRTSEKIDWFDVEIDVIFDNFKLAFSRFSRHILDGNYEYPLPDGRIFVLPDEWFTDYRALFLHGESSEESIKIKKIHFGVLGEAFAESSFMERFRQKPFEHRIALPKNLRAVLRTYQELGFQWLVHLRELNFGACLADDMGLGKTIQTIALLEYVHSADADSDDSSSGVELQLSLFDSLKAKTPVSMIVAPASLLYNWKNELHRFAPNLRICVYGGNRRLKSKAVGRTFEHYDVIIISYGLLRSDVEFLNSYTYSCLVLDESQYIKNPDSVIYRSVISLRANQRIALTGTPIENSLSDLWAQLNFINPGLLGELGSFKKNYIDRSNSVIDESRRNELLKLIAPFILRRTKEEVAPELPPLLQEIIYCDMSEEQEKLYSGEKNRIRLQIENRGEEFFRHDFTALQSLLHLRLLANHPILADSEYSGDSGKFEQILTCFENVVAGGHKVLIFSSFVRSLKFLAGVFDERGVRYAMLTGSTRDREGEVKKFIYSEVNCFLISLKAGGVGLNLVEADYVFIIDPWWNPAAEMQALSRAHRIGQNKNVIVYRFISNDTVEEKIIVLQEQKRLLAENFMGSNDLVKEDLMKLLTDG
ncbi:MAG: hypothetical protein LBC98_03695 [Prevotellaceae bacterium]|jgi:SNF2 family DNA or RNA helicase|nr:hypothetical protein [Prevotellaceae bacterium]